MKINGLAEFEKRIKKTSSCWEWMLSPCGKYGFFYIGYGLYLYAHRVAWEFYRGPIPQGLHVLHHCDNPICINPEHLFVGTLQDNATDMVNKGRHAGQKRTHCPRGHALVHPNLVKIPKGRSCRKCHNLVALRYHHAKKGRI